MYGTNRPWCLINDSLRRCQVNRTFFIVKNFLNRVVAAMPNKAPVSGGWSGCVMLAEFAWCVRSSKWTYGKSWHVWYQVVLVDTTLAADMYEALNQDSRKQKCTQCMERIDHDVWLTLPGECDIFLTLSLVRTAMPNNKQARSCLNLKSLLLDYYRSNPMIIIRWWFGKKPHLHGSENIWL